MIGRVSPEEHEPVSASKSPRVGRTQIIIFLVVVPFALLFGRAMIQGAQGGELVCSRAQNRCEIQNGWLIRERIVFPANELSGAKSVYFVKMNRKIYSVSVVTRQESFALGGSDRPEHAKVVAAIDAFAHDAKSPSLEARIAPDTVRYVIVAFLALIYGLFGLALVVAWVRQRAIVRST